MTPPVFITLTEGGFDLANRLASGVQGAEVHGLKGRADDANFVFTDTLAHLQEIFTVGKPIVGICAVGILVRALAPVLVDKRSEPPVLAISENGSAVVPLLGGHNGANRWLDQLVGRLRRVWQPRDWQWPSPAVDRRVPSPMTRHRRW